MDKGDVVEIFNNVRPPGSQFYERQKTGEGVFQAFGLDVVEVGDSVASFSVAIVQMSDGTIQTQDVSFVAMKKETQKHFD